jgi:hypothetical protein
MRYFSLNPMRLNLLEQGRATEWLTSFVILGFAITLALPGDTLVSGAFKAFRDVGLDEAAISTPLALVATTRLLALFINGAHKRTPILRMIGAVIGASVFAMLSMAFLWPTLSYGAPISTGVSAYFILAGFDALSAYRSGADVRMVHSLFGQLK